MSDMETLSFATIVQL